MRVLCFVCLFFVHVLFLFGRHQMRWNDRFQFALASLFQLNHLFLFFLTLLWSLPFGCSILSAFFSDANESLNWHKSQQKSSYSKIDNFFSFVCALQRALWMWMAFATQSLIKCGVWVRARFCLCFCDLCKYLFWSLSIHSIILVRSAQLTHKTDGCDKIKTTHCNLVNY